MSIQPNKEIAEDCGLINDKLERVAANIRQQKSALIAFSGGVDSSVVAALAKQALGDKAVAVTVDHGALRDGEVERAALVAKAVGLHHLSVTVNPLNVPEVKKNQPDRCYHCKTLIFNALRRLADDLRLASVMDGSNASDLSGYRPGLKALGEMHVVSPLLGVTKDEVRSFARLLGLTNADAPTDACLLTSFPYGTTITKARIERLRSAERALKAIGIARARVRDHNDFARIEIEREDAEKVVTHSSAIVETFLALGFTYVTLDLEWFRSGSMDLR